MTDLVEDAAMPEVMPPAMPWTPPAGPVALSKAKIAEIKALAEKADQLVEASLSANTRLAYGKAWRAWSEWCLGFGLDPTGEGLVTLSSVAAMRPAPRPAQAATPAASRHAAIASARKRRCVRAVVR